MLIVKQNRETSVHGQREGNRSREHLPLPAKQKLSIHSNNPNSAPVCLLGEFFLQIPPLFSFLPWKLPLIWRICFSVESLFLFHFLGKQFSREWGGEPRIFGGRWGGGFRMCSGWHCADWLFCFSFLCSVEKAVRDQDRRWVRWMFVPLFSVVFGSYILSDC